MKAKHRYDQEEYFKWLENGADEDLVEILVFKKRQDADDPHGQAQRKIEYCLRYELPDGYYTCEFISGVASIEEAKEYAETQVSECERFIRVAAVYAMEKK